MDKKNVYIALQILGNILCTAGTIMLVVWAFKDSKDRKDSLRTTAIVFMVIGFVMAVVFNVIRN